MTYLIVGRDIVKKDEKINELKNRLFKDPSSLAFDFEMVSGHKLDSDDLRKSLLSLPQTSSCRMVIIRQCEKINERIREILLDFIVQEISSLVLVLDYGEIDARSSFYAKIKPHVKLISFGEQKAVNVFDMTRAIASRDAAGAMKILHELIVNNTHPLQIMGGLVWFWSKERERLSVRHFEKGLKILQEGDLNIKRSRLKAEYAVEKVVVELASL